MVSILTPSEAPPLWRASRSTLTWTEVPNKACSRPLTLLVTWWVSCMHVSFRPTRVYIIIQVGSLGAGQISDKWGRRYGMGIGSLICLIGAIFQAAAQNTNWLISGRVVLGLGAVIAQTAGAFYVLYICKQFSEVNYLPRSSICCRIRPSRLSRYLDWRVGLILVVVLSAVR